MTRVQRNGFRNAMTKFQTIFEEATLHDISELGWPTSPIDNTADNVITLYDIATATPNQAWSPNVLLLPAPAPEDSRRERGRVLAVVLAGDPETEVECD